MQEKKWSAGEYTVKFWLAACAHVMHLSALQQLV